ncbi:cytochrome C biosynthesis protein [Flavobacterium sp. HXWNR69]|uniref:Cytochrome C biosynthesis protein n=1 Tax=Flavobacterium fragile TaxID=2949085 RepID=A0ABT0TF42_9FLAO|nr:tetratricopeptide repeat protein [Flavobacterium sp. HXWNR69]MCL9769597.1 cytochrome C biosynthesis protein [Flavobacterium sp. HXWNR69]
MIKKTHIAFLAFLLFSFGNHLFAQDNPDAIALVDDQLENNFYEAMKQRGIENYDKAIVAIQKCIEKEPTNAAFQYELGKNYLSLKNYVDAESAFKKAVELDNKQRWYWNGLYDVYYQTKDFQKSIPIVEKLIEFDANMKEDLVSLYMNTNQHAKALELLNNMESSSKLTRTMEFYKLRLQETNKLAKPQKEQLEDAIKKNPKVEQNYIDLIVFYTNLNQEEKAFEVAKQLEREIPSSDWAHVSLVKFHLNNNDGENASKSMFKVLENDRMDLKIKHRVFNEFLIFAVKNSTYLKEIDKAIPYFDNDKEINVAKEVAKFFWKKNDLEKTAYYFEKALKKNSDDIDAMELYLEVLIQKQDFLLVTKKSEEYLESFPTQSGFYFYAGLGYNQLKEYKKAKNNLENGLDFVVENPSLEANFYKQLIISCENLNDNAKKQVYTNKLKQLQK